MLVPQQAAVDIDDVVATSVPADDAANIVTDDVVDDVVDQQPSLPPPQPQPSQTTTIFMDLLNNLLETWGIIELIDVDEDVILEEVGAKKDAKVAKENADVQGRQEESQAHAYHIDLKYVDKVLSMHDDEPELAELKEVIDVVTIAKLMTKVVTAAATTITAALITAATITAAPSAARKRQGVVIRDPEETATPSTIIHSEPKSKDKGKGIMVEEPKPLK
nr:hypothetical protein [Tanacetum cinerariifolium]